MLQLGHVERRFRVVSRKTGENFAGRDAYESWLGQKNRSGEMRNGENVR